MAIYLVQDLIALDYCQQELEAFRNLSIKYRNLINTQDTLINKLQATERNLKINLNLSNGVAEEQGNKIIKLEKDLKQKTKAKRIWTVIATAALTGAAVIYTSCKEF